MFHIIWSRRTFSLPRTSSWDHKLWNTIFVLWKMRENKAYYTLRISIWKIIPRQRSLFLGKSKLRRFMASNFEISKKLKSLETWKSILRVFLLLRNEHHGPWELLNFFSNTFYFISILLRSYVQWDRWEDAVEMVGSRMYRKGNLLSQKWCLEFWGHYLGIINLWKEAIPG